MDSIVPWITLVLLLLISLLQQSCAIETLSCTGPSWTPTNNSVLYNDCLPSDNLTWVKETNTVNVNVIPPVTIHFTLEFAKQLADLRSVSTKESNSCGATTGSLVQWDHWEPRNGGGTMQVGFISFEFDKSSKLVAIEPTCFTIITVIITGSNTGSNTRSDTSRVAMGLGIAAGLVAIILVAVVVMMRRRLPWHKLSPVNSRNSKDSEFSSVNDLSDLEVGAPRLYTYKELSSATQSFSSKYVVGEGGFGTVYKGLLKDTPHPVAIKRLSQYARQGAREFVAEVKIISQLRHRNLVQLLGWCLEKDELILVYEYMPNGDLDDLIYADKPKCDLCWKQRYNVLGGVATALVYLHEEWVQRVIHRDVKTSNVMLDSNLNARLGDFGLARLSAHSQAPQTTLVAGTLGYLAPEFSMSGKATDKTDVYAFGVVALEVTCGRRPLSPDLILVDWVWDLHKRDKLLDAVDPRLDRKLRSTDDEIQMTIVLQLGLLCAHPDPNGRPSMRQVLNMLNGEASVPRVPRSKPVASYFEDD